VFSDCFAGLVLLAILLWTVHDTENDKDEACKAHGWCNFDTSCAEYIGVEKLFCTTASAHENETQNNYGHAYGQ
jgi:hypothetical protein